LYEFVLWETDEPAYFNNNRLPESDFLEQLFGRQSLTVRYISKIYRQELSHQTIQGQFLTVQLKSALSSPGDYFPVSRSRLSEYAFPKFINAWLLDPTPAQSLF
jgi:A/G-specific adenine glycosylase